MQKNVLNFYLFIYFQGKSKFYHQVGNATYTVYYL